MIFVGGVGDGVRHVRGGIRTVARQRDAVRFDAIVLQRVDGALRAPSMPAKSAVTLQAL